MASVSDVTDPSQLLEVGVATSCVNLCSIPLFSVSEIYLQQKEEMLEMINVRRVEWVA
jgi:hypothetical protein